MQYVVIKETDKNISHDFAAGLKGLPKRDFGILTTRKQVNQV